MLSQVLSFKRLEKYMPPTKDIGLCLPKNKVKSHYLALSFPTNKTVFLGHGLALGSELVTRSADEFNTKGLPIKRLLNKGDHG